MDKFSLKRIETKVTASHSKYNKTVLQNGISVVSEEVPHVRSVSVGAWINVGSRDENEQNNGITHFIEHMVFKGTKRLTSQQIARSLESHGGYLNAFTTKEHTCFYARILDEYLPKAIDVISDLVQQPLLESKDIEKERFVILEELKNIEDDPDDLIHDYLDFAIYHNHPLGFQIIGKRENIQRLTRDELFEYINVNYTPSRTVIAAAGNVKHDILVALVEQFFRSKDNRKDEFRRVPCKNYNVAKKSIFEKPIHQAHVCMGIRGFSVKSKMRYPLLVLNTLLGEGMSSRLFRNIREKFGLAYNLYSFANMLSDTGIWGIYIGTDNNKIEHSIDLIVKELEKLKAEEVSKNEIQRVKAQLKGSLLLSLESMSNRMMRLGSGEIYFGKHISIDQVLTKIDSVKPEDIFNVANKLFDIEKFSTIIFKSKNNNN